MPRSPAASLPLLLAAALVFSGCATNTPENAPLERWNPDAGYRTPKGYDSGDVLLVLALSGGGTRAASLAYGALEELRDTELPGGRRLLDEVDVVFGVSGGSVVAAYYALHGDRIFEDFEAKFLKSDVQSRLIARLFWPRYWHRRVVGGYDRTDVVTDYYDTELFEGATFADLEKRAPPLVHITATDVSTGRPFPFVQERFDLICSDLDQLKLARAVASSTALPGMFVPVTLRNYSGSCGYEPPAWVHREMEERDPASRRFDVASLIQEYQDNERRPFIHLSDGGNADNLGLRAPLDEAIGEGGLLGRIERFGFVIPKRVQVIVVDAKIDPDRDMDQTASPPGAFTVVNTLMGVGANRYTLETMDLLRAQLREWVDEFPKERRGEPASVHLTHVSFARIVDDEQRRFFNNVPTTFRLPSETVDRLRELSRQQIRSSDALQALLASLRASG